MINPKPDRSGPGDAPSDVETDAGFAVDDLPAPPPGVWSNALARALDPATQPRGSLSDLVPDILEAPFPPDPDTAPPDPDLPDDDTTSLDDTDSDEPQPNEPAASDEPPDELW